MPVETLARLALDLFGIHLTGRQVLALLTYERELLTWNEQFNLTAIRDVQGVRIKHFLDSFSCVLAWKGCPPECLVDVGTGAGFPGLALKILYPAMQLTLVESISKKAAFCLHIVETLKLEKVTILSRRAEDVGQMPEHRQAYDWGVARAVAKMPALVEYVLPLVKVGGTMLAQKGSSGPAETNQAAGAIKVLGGRLAPPITIRLPGMNEERYLILIEKVTATPDDYPRKPGVPLKTPL
ncbi:MAG: 16S rRNA (guanine(527)-N(7))-methyltransferase RsmG [Anaerolineales bacterium]|nr:16S rRNA (guanine(527)-N(7))-methyltransferase RsmG [Anaerolineales bacterium]